MTNTFRRRAFVLVLLVVGSAVGWACSNDNPDTAGNGTNNPNAPADLCAHPNAGCPCTDANQVAECGRVELKVGSYVTCSMGKTTCDGTKWGECVGDTIVAKSFSGGGLRFASLGASSACANPCDPYCQNFVDTPGGLDAAGMNSTEAGLSINPPSSACLCDQPSGPPATLYSNLTYKGNPAVCTGGGDGGVATDTCNHDYGCNAGTCAPYSVSAVNPACTAAPDYTLGLGCYNGAAWELQLCNRGYVPSPGVGTLSIVVNTGAPTGTPGTYPYPSGPALAAPTSTAKGRCDLNLALAANAIGPGQCINVNTSTQCTATAGGALVLNGTEWAVINPDPTILPGYVQVAECDKVNNFTSLEATSGRPPALGSAGSCVPNSLCGTVCGGASDAGVEGGAGCHTYVSGYVWDPGANVTLPGIAVYQPSGALISFPAAVSCETCASLLSPYVSSTFSDLTGHFSLEINATSNVPVVFQTGRWRRQIHVGGAGTDWTNAIVPCQDNIITDNAKCGTPGGVNGVGQLPGYPGTNCITRLPQKTTEGHIPSIAIVSGGLEPLECDIAKFMGGTTQFGSIADSTATKPIQIMTDNGSNIAGQPANGPDATLLLNSLANYDMVMFGCPGSSSNVTTKLNAAQQQNLYNYLTSGGRAFFNHWSALNSLMQPHGGQGGAINPPNGLANTSTWAVISGGPGQDYGRVLGVTTAHTNMQTWLNLNGAYPTGGSINIGSNGVKESLAAATTDEFVYVRGKTNNTWTPDGDHNLAYSADFSDAGKVPTILGDGGAGPGCGRFVFSGGHVDSSRGTAGGVFPTASCKGTDLTPNLSPGEKMFEYLTFLLSSCSIGGAAIVPSAPPAPPVPPALAAVSFTRDYHAVCPVGTVVVWQAFSWTAAIPGGTSIVFTARTAADASGVPGPFGVAVPVGTAAVSTGATAYTPPTTVDQDLTTAVPAQRSLDWLEIQMTFNPAGVTSPVLQSWNQAYDCAPAE
jgi:hypothetical protein